MDDARGPLSPTGNNAAMTQALCLTEEHVRRFADASGDRNPLHVDESFARRTPYGRRIAHGGLVTVAALGLVDADALRHVDELDLQFKQPVFLDEAYAVSRTHSDDEKTRIEVSTAEQLTAAVTVIADRSRPALPRPPRQEFRGTPRAPRRYSIEQLLKGVSIAEAYACHVDALAALATDVGARDIPDTVLTWLGAASYAVGMLVPGRDGVFISARIRRSSADASGTLSASVTTADDRTGLVVVEAALAQGRVSARMTLHAFARPATPIPDRSSIAQYLPPSTDLAKKQILVVGASRGLGAAVCGALATQGATVWAAFASSAEHAEGLRREFGADRIRLLQFDAADIAQSRRSFATLRAEAGALDGAILCAAPPLYETALHPDASERTLRFVESSIALTLVPLSEAVQLLAPQGQLVVMSSSALNDIPEPWPQYVVAKAALEGVAAYCARHTPARVLVVRPPKMWTDSTNTLLGRIGAARPEQVAAGIVKWMTAEQPASGEWLLTPEELL